MLALLGRKMNNEQAEQELAALACGAVKCAFGKPLRMLLRPQWPRRIEQISTTSLGAASN